MNGKKAKMLRNAAKDGHGIVNEQHYKDMKRVFRTITLMESQKPKLVEPRVRKSTQLGVHLRNIGHMIVVKPLRAIRLIMLERNVHPDGRHYPLTSSQKTVLSGFQFSPKSTLDYFAS